MTSWTSEQRIQLTELWGAGRSVNAIAGQLRITRNAVIGAAHRMGLPARPSPIRLGKPLRAKPRGERLIRPKPPPLPQLPSLQAATSGPSAGDGGRPRASVRGRCCWVLSRGRPWRFCDEPVSAPGSAWCSQHRSIVYYPVKAPL